MAAQTQTEPDLSIDPEAGIIFAQLFELGIYRFKAFHGGRGGGKSHAAAEACVLLGFKHKLRILCCREVQHSIRDSVKRLLDDYIDKLGLRWFYRSTDSEIRGLNGTLIVFVGLLSGTSSSRGAPIDSIKSKEGFDIAWIEEAQTVSQRSWDLLIRTIRAPGSEIWATWNPRSPSDPIDALFRGGEPPPRSLVVEVNYWDNPWFPPELQEDVEWLRGRDYEKYCHIYRGEYQRSVEAAVFRNWREGPVTAPDDAIFFFGADWGFSVDPSVLIRCFIKGRTLYIDKEAYAVGCDIDYLPSLFAGSDIRFHHNGLPIDPRWDNPKGYPGIPGATKWTIRADSSRPETIQHVAKRGFTIVGARKGPGSVEEGVNFRQNRHSNARR